MQARDPRSAVAKPVGIDVVPADQPMERLTQQAGRASGFRDNDSMPVEQRNQGVSRGASTRKCHVLSVRKRGEMHQPRGASSLIGPRVAQNRDELLDDLVSCALGDTQDGNVGR